MFARSSLTRDRAADIPSSTVDALKEITFLPLPPEKLPKSIRRFANVDAPTPARMMAAKGLVPAKGGDLVSLLCQLANDADSEVKRTATESLNNLPDTILLPACGQVDNPSLLHGVSEFFANREDVLMEVLQNRAASDFTYESIAKACSENLCERIALDQQRLLGAPKIIEALYNNTNTRSSTADRLVELAVRNNVDLSGIPAFKLHAEAIKGQLIPEPTEEPLPGDDIFAKTVEVDHDEDAFEVDEEEGTEELNSKSKPLSFQIMDMNLAEKIRLAAVGNAAARSILVRDQNKLVCMAAISSAKMREREAAKIAVSKEVTQEVLRYIGNRKKWARNYEIKRALVFNPKTPMGIALRFLGHMRENDVKALGKTRGVRGALKTAALARLRKREKK